MTKGIGHISRRSAVVMLMAVALTAALPEAGFAARQGAVLLAQSGQDRAQEAVRRGLIRPVREIIRSIASQYRGNQLGASLSENGRDNWVYTVKWITPKRDVLSFRVNAGTAQILNVRGRGAAAARK